MKFRYRYVRFGTNFENRKGFREPDGARTDPSGLFENEIAVDVGGVCWGYLGEERSVLDHHFVRVDQFPSASVAVLQNASRIREKFSGLSAPVTWLVSHQNTDFDAFCALYLVRSLLEGNSREMERGGLAFSPDGREDGAGPKIDWFLPDVSSFPSEDRWWILLASYASAVDNGRRIPCPKNRALHSILYAALARGRNYGAEDSGAKDFFDEVKRAIEIRGLNPFFDSVFEDNAMFSPELNMLDRESEAYDRDLLRSRKAIVLLQQPSDPFPVWYDRLRSRGLLDSDLSTADEHLEICPGTRTQADGIYLRDPECLLFKEWARLDTKNSSTGSGFLFTAIAYSNGRPNSAQNHSDYFFAIDPEKAGGTCLYSLWAKLASAEVRILKQPAHAGFREKLEQLESQAESASGATTCRSGFEARAGSYRAFFDDPWSDGSNYSCTIIGTPNRGTLIGDDGKRSDLLDDPVVAIVREELENAVYASDVSLSDLSATRERKNETTSAFPTTRMNIPAPAPGVFRLATVKLAEGVDPSRSSMALQIGTALWHVLHPELHGLPTDFLNRHLFCNPDWIGVWSRRGIILAHKERATTKVEASASRFRELVTLAKDTETYIQSPGSYDLVETGEALLRRVSELTYALSFPENRLLSRFFEAIRLGEVVVAIRGLNRAAAERLRNEKLDAQTRQFTKNTRTVADVQTKVEWLEVFFVGFYSTELSHIITELLGLKDSVALTVVTFVGIIFTLAALWALKPWAHAKSKKQKRNQLRLATILFLLAILWAAGLSASGKLSKDLLKSYSSESAQR